MRELLKRKIAAIEPDTYERVLACSIMSNRFSDVRQSRHFRTREQMWDAAFSGDGPVSVLEFGVYRGDSMRYFTGLNSHERSNFFGFDSFTGLPEDWKENHGRGVFDVQGSIPDISDPRVEFIKGWFQNTLPVFLRDRAGELNERLIVHYDADLYSSTLYCLSMMDGLKRPYTAIFDEFIGHETRALYNYVQMYGSKLAFHGWTGNNAHWPDRALCTIEPQEVYDV